MCGKRKEKQLEDLQPGDIVEALITDEKLPDNKLKHKFIIIGYAKPKGNSKKRHKLCVSACSFSSSMPQIESEDFIQVDQGTIPFGFFDTVKDVTLLRLGRIKCIEVYQYKEHCGSLTTIPDLWRDVCQKINTKFGLELGDFDNVCECSCLDNHQVELDYCSQDMYYLLHDKCKDSSVDCCKVCGCCGHNFDNSHDVFENCPKCHDNL